MVLIDDGELKVWIQNGTYSAHNKMVCGCQDPPEYYRFRLVNGQEEQRGSIVVEGVRCVYTIVIGCDPSDIHYVLLSSRRPSNRLLVFSGMVLSKKKVKHTYVTTTVGTHSSGFVILANDKRLSPVLWFSPRIKLPTSRESLRPQDFLFGKKLVESPWLVSLLTM